MLFRILFATLICDAIIHASEDWPTWQHDNRRTGVSTADVDPVRLVEAWAWRSTAPPQTAWHGPAKWDAYAFHRNLPSMRSYDNAFHVIAVGDSVWFGSSVDDSLHCLDAITGKSLWRYVTDAPVRLAPTWANGRVYFGSDDGYARCVDGRTGRLIWKSIPAQCDRRILNNGRFVHPQPCRTGVVVDGGNAWFANAMLPWNEAWLSCVDASDGTVVRDEHYVRPMPGETMEGAPALSSSHLIVPQGRVAPRLFDRNSGEDLGAMVKSGGGSVVVVSLDEQVIHGPATDSRKGGFRRSDSKTREVVAGLGRGNALVVDGRTSYMLTDTHLVASELTSGKVLWKRPTDCPCRLIKAGNWLFAGGNDLVAAYSAVDGRKVWSAEVDGRVFGLSAARGRVFASTDIGVIHCFSPSDSATPVVVERHVEHHVRKSTAVAPDGDSRLLGHWAFQSADTNGTTIRALHGDSITLAQQPVFRSVGQYEALELDGRDQSVMISPQFRSAALPDQNLTAAAWVRLDQKQEWGGIVGVIQDDGDVENGWLLGYRKDRFSFAISAESGNKGLSYVTSKKPFEAERWYHVAASYDGNLIRLYVDGELQSESMGQSGPIRYPDRGWYEIGAYHDSNEYFRLKGAVHEVSVYNEALGADEITRVHDAAQSRFPARQSYPELKSGPFLTFLTPSSARIRWTTEHPVATRLLFDVSGTSRESGSRELRVDHQVDVDDLKHNRVYEYQIDTGAETESSLSRRFECDTFFNYSPRVHASDRSSDLRDDALARLMQLSGERRGIGVLLGNFSATELREFCTSSNLRYVNFTSDPEYLSRIRMKLLESGLYGRRITVHQMKESQPLPIVGACANVVVVRDKGNLLEAEARRITRPNGGVACFVDQNTNSDNPLEDHSDLVAGSQVAVFRRSPLAGARNWSHLYGNTDNSAYNGEELGGALTTEDLGVQWVGRPGPRYQADRSGRKPSPLSTNGRLFLQGLGRLLALDAFNGTVLWSIEIPSLGRFNVPRDSSNWCASDDAVFVVVKDECWKIDAATGELREKFSVGLDAAGREWGFVATSGGRLYGTDVPEGTSWTDFWGGGDAGWYDARSGAVTYPVCSDRVFCRHPDTGEMIWEYQRGVVLNSTVTIDGETMYFLESRSASVVESGDRRVGDPDLWQHLYLVAVDSRTGSPKWEKAIAPMKPQVVCYVAHAADQLTMVTSSEGRFHVQSLSDLDGASRWSSSAEWNGGKGDHGKAMARPAIVGNRIFLRPHVLSLSDGSIFPEKMPDGHGCGTYSCTSGSVIYRARTVTMWAPESDTRSTWDRLRPDCWLSTIPAGGMLLSPEGGGGCSCGSWMETSVGFMPRVFDPMAQ